MQGEFTGIELCKNLYLTGQAMGTCFREKPGIHARLFALKKLPIKCRQ